MPCGRHDHPPWPKHGGRRLRIEACETICGWCTTYTTKSANNLRVHARRHLRNPKEKLDVIIVKGKAGRGRVKGDSPSTEPQNKQSSSRDLERLQSLSVTPDLSSRQLDDERPLSDVCLNCETFKSEIDSRDKRIASLEAQLQDFGTAVRLFASGEPTKPFTNLQPGEVSEEQIVRSALSVVEYKRTGNFEDVSDVAVRILENHNTAWVVDDPQQNIRNALSFLGLEMTGGFINAPQLARRIIQRGDWDLSMNPPPLIIPEQKSVDSAASHVRLPPNNSTYGYLENREAAATATRTNTETENSWLGSDNTPTNAEPGDQYSFGDIQAPTEKPSHNRSISNENNGSMSLDPWYTNGLCLGTPKDFSEQNTSNLVCQICHKHVKTQSELKKHELRHRKPFKCEVLSCSCTEGFSTTKDLDRHMRSKHLVVLLSNKIPEKRWRCLVPGCESHEKTWSRLDIFRSHLKGAHFHLLPESELEEVIRRAEYWEQPKTDGSEEVQSLRRHNRS